MNSDTDTKRKLKAARERRRRAVKAGDDARIKQADADIAALTDAPITEAEAAESDARISEAWSTAFKVQRENAEADRERAEQARTVTVARCHGLNETYPDADGNPTQCVRNGRHERDGHPVCGQHAKMIDAGRSLPLLETA